MVLFPSYARQHTKSIKIPPEGHQPQDPREDSSTGMDAEYWRREWELFEDANAIVDVDIRGWIYAPHRGPLTRKNRILLGIARRLSGIPAPSDGDQTGREDEIAEREAREITKRGEREADVAGRGGFSEKSGHHTSRASTASRSPSPRPGDIVHPLTDTSLEGASGISRKSWAQPSNMSSEDLAMANSHLSNRIMPFLTNPSMQLPITIFFFNEDTSQSRTTTTNDSGHFNFRAALNFVPTHVRVLASEDLSAVEEVRVIEPQGVSLISDIDDTIKHTAIGSGAREIFRNAFIRDLGDLTIEGVKEWYTAMANQGVKLHYLSNSPWQMYPLLVSYFASAGLPPGSFHLKHYTGMLQGIFEPVAERKKGTLDRIMNDFQDRRFILVGDSGEADLELYTETALANPGRILGIFIRDVTTAPTKPFFESSIGDGSTSALSGAQRRDQDSTESSSGARPGMPPRAQTVQAILTQEPESEDLMDFSSDSESGTPAPQAPTSSNIGNGASAKRPPPRPPVKPQNLRSASTDSTKFESKDASSSTMMRPTPPPKPRKLSSHEFSSGSKPAVPVQVSRSPALSRTPSRDSSLERHGYRASVKNKMAAAYSYLPSPSAYWNGTDEQQRESGVRAQRSAESLQSPPGLTVNDAPPPLPRRNLSSYPAAAAQYASNKLWYGSGSEDDRPIVNKREDLWNRRLERARDSLKGKGVMLMTWRVGQDAMKDAMRLVEEYNKGSRLRSDGR